MSIEIRGPLELPARREDIELKTADGLTLVGELSAPEHRTADGDPRGRCTRCRRPVASWTRTSSARPPLASPRSRTSPCCVSTHGGPHRPEARAMAPSTAGLPRGTTSRRPWTSSVIARFPRPWLLGWSFGTELALKYGRDHDIEGIILPLAAPPPRDAGGGRLLGGYRTPGGRPGAGAGRLPAPGRGSGTIRSDSARHPDRGGSGEAPLGGRDADAASAHGDRGGGESLSPASRDAMAGRRVGVSDGGIYRAH